MQRLTFRDVSLAEARALEGLEWNDASPKKSSARSKRSAGRTLNFIRNEFPADWREFLSLLISHRVKFVVVGGHAFAAHARPRITEDLDVFVEASEVNARRLRTVLCYFGSSICFHCSIKPRVVIQRFSSARSIVVPDTSSIERMSRRCFSDPRSRKYSSFLTMTYSIGAMAMVVSPTSR